MTKKCFVLLMKLNREKFPVDKIAIRIDMYYLCIDVLNLRFSPMTNTNSIIFPS